MIPTPNENQQGLDLSNPIVDEAAAAAQLAQQQQQYTESLPTAMQEQQAQQQQEASQQEQELTARAGEVAKNFTEQTDIIDTVAQGIDGLLGTNLAEIRQENKEARQAEDFGNKVATNEARDDIATESIRAVVGGRMDAVNQALNTGELIGDTAKTWLGIASEEDNIYSDDYERANWNLTASENNTAIGKLVRGGFKLHTAMFGLKKLGVGGGQIAGRTVSARAARVAQETFRGALADVIVTDPSDGTMVQMAGELFGIEEDSPSSAPSLRP